VLFTIEINNFSLTLSIPGSGLKVQGLQLMEVAHDIDQDQEYPA
jgi:hypothetical protein